MTGCTHTPLDGTIRNFVRGGADNHLGGGLNETLIDHNGELRFG